MARFDIDAAAVVIEGKVHRRVLRQSQTYDTMAGAVVIDERSLERGRSPHVRREDGRDGGVLGAVLAARRRVVGAPGRGGARPTTGSSGFGLDEEERRAVLDLEGWDQAEPVVAMLPTEAKRAFVSSLVDAASSDGRLSPLEAKAVQGMSKALGLD